MFGTVQERLAEAGIAKGKTLLVDSTTVEANAALRSIVRLDTGEPYQDYLTGLAKASGIRTPTRAVLGNVGTAPCEQGREQGMEVPVGYRR